MTDAARGTFRLWKKALALIKTDGFDVYSC
jgi:hypothetical protein